MKWIDEGLNLARSRFGHLDRPERKLSTSSVSIQYTTWRQSN